MGGDGLAQAVALAEQRRSSHRDQELHDGVARTER